MIYIVAGSQRTGTSMMMRALMAGGLQADYDPSRDQMNDQYGDEDYKPNAGGFYELRKDQYQAVGFPRAHEGKLIKVLNEGVLKIAPRSAEDPYRIVFMRRDAEEMRQSWQAFFGVNMTHPAADDERQDIIEGALRMRRDCDVVTVRYRDFLTGPPHHSAWFSLMVYHGWPIDPATAAATIDPALCHMKREELAVGA